MMTNIGREGAGRRTPDGRSAITATTVATVGTRRRHSGDGAATEPYEGGSDEWLAGAAEHLRPGR
ncbi:hypothetical protein GCM10017559_55880 [Streptosporangium longisporum]|uniref:Uncharacterized protein n=1 Tax=Streptosporangium longisporum TaxID=46187 RepID=A0ABP6KYC5_9ACTN